MSEQNYFPDNWVVIKIKEGKLDRGFYKVLAGWSGGYLSGDSWRMNSGITKVTEEGDHLKFWGESGSCYVCHKKTYGLRMNNSGVWNQMKGMEGFEDQFVLLPEDTNWLEIEW